jgi:very-short-patch-repair endonuclease
VASVTYDSRKGDTSRLARLATRQEGVVHVRQLRALGFSDRAITYLVSIGQLHRLHTGVYAVGHTRLSRHARWLAAVMACKTPAGTSVLSFRPASALHEIVRSMPSGPIDVTSTSRHRLRGIRAHHVRELDPADTTTVAGIPVTTVARTYLDLAETLAHGRLIDALEHGLRIDKFDMNAVEATIARNPGRHGIKPLTAAISQLPDLIPNLWSNLEVDVNSAFRFTDFPQPQTNVLVEGEPVDCYWPEHGLILQIDGDRYHKLRSDRANAARVDRKLTLAGHRVVRVTDTEWARDQAHVIADIRSLLGL